MRRRGVRSIEAGDRKNRVPVRSDHRRGEDWVRAVHGGDPSSISHPPICVGWAIWIKSIGSNAKIRLGSRAAIRPIADTAGGPLIAAGSAAVRRRQQRATNGPDDAAAPPIAMRRVRTGLARCCIGVPTTREAERSPSGQSHGCRQYSSEHDPTPISWSACRYCSARALAAHGTLNIIELRCEGGTAMPTIESSRRAFIKTMGVVAAAATCGRAASAKAADYKPHDQKKLTPAAAQYQDRPKENESCASCPYFVLSESCVLVEGEISANGWCPMYTTFSPLDRGAHA